ncbi:hypothetical protein AVEN_271421-1 [Araneus ventricosus]|uniref:Uncharacterized protein n=1 Tax=Araneus ventricosus TaxID=182803 RepID=A0A4Y2H4R5_ARAVE|nr:hypothetical protein AVEN_271421-1 [Araneus ventricosus]
MIHLQNICFEKFCDVKLTSSEHVDTRPSRIARDNEDAAKLSQWLSEHNPFPKIDVIMSIDSGIVGGNEQAVEDADLTIVNTAISVAPQYDYVRVVGEDIDLLVLPTALASTHSNVFFQKCGRGKTPDSYYSITSFNHKFSNELLFIHAISGCDITSALFGQGKNKFISLFLKHEELLNRAATFLNPQATTEKVTKAGENVLVALYGGDPATQNLDEVRYHSFGKAAANTKVNLARLPPTTDATQLHAMRSYHQVQTWLGNEKDPLKWGWMHTP